MAIVYSPRNIYPTQYTTTYETISGGRRLYTRNQKLRLGYVDTNYHLAAALGALKSMRYEFIDVTTVDGSYIAYGNEWTNAVGWSLNSPLNENEARSRAAEFFYKNATDLNKFNLGVALAEAKETVGLISSTALRLGSAYRNLRKGRVNDAFAALGVSSRATVPYRLRGFSGRTTVRQHQASLRRRALKTKDLTKFAANSWLEMRYGWTPLLYDVYGAAEFAAELMLANRRDLTISGVYKWEGDLRPSPTLSITTEKAIQVARYDAHFEIDDPNIRNLNALGLVNPAVILWESVPFSFVVDWFLPVGQWLESFSALSGLKYLEGTNTYFERMKGKAAYNANGWLPGRDATVDSTVLFRNSGGVPSIPLPRFSLYERMNGNRFLDAMALLRVVAGGR